MGKLIDAETVKEYLKRVIWGADRKIDGWVEVMPAVDAVPVVRCKDCAHCFELVDTDPLTPYRHREGAIGFFCQTFDMDFYTPRYDAGTYYCADGKRREN